MKKVLIFGLLIGFLAFSTTTFAGSIKTTSPERAGFDSERLDRAVTLVEKAIEDGNTPGAVLVVGRGDKVVLAKAMGYAEIKPNKRRTQIDTVYDMASLTKPIATATSIMILLEQGKLRLSDKVSKYIPEFEANEKGNITIKDCLIHSSGLPSYTNSGNIKKEHGAVCPDETKATIFALEKRYETGTKFSYSCLGFITLAEVVNRVSGEPVNIFSKKHIFDPLGMKDSGYLPQGAVKARCAATQTRDGKPMTGEVHDPLAYLNGGVSGNAGLFSSAPDLVIFSQMMLNGGNYKKAQILSPYTVAAMTSIQSPSPEMGRGFGWDLDSGYSSNQGDLFSKKTFGHTGFTGTSLVIDPETGVYVILLANRVHHSKGGVVTLRAKVANAVASALVNPEKMEVKPLF